jgi:putative methyltransferase
MSGRYKEAASVYGRVSRGHGGLKALTFNDKVKHKGSTYALVCETLKHRQLIDRILKKCNVTLAMLGRDESLVMIMLFDLLFGKKIQGGGAVKRAIMTHEPKFREVLATLIENEGEKGMAGLLPEGVQNASKLRRFARVNSILAPPGKRDHCSFVCD